MPWTVGSQVKAGANLAASSAILNRRRVVRPLAAVAVTARPTIGSGQDALEFSPIINGCWQLAGGHGREVFDDVQSKLWAHAQAGFTTYDSADIYGPSEAILGEFQREWAAAGNAPVQVFTKYVPNIFNDRPTPAKVEAALRRSMQKLQVSRLDLVQLHWWDYSIPGMVDTALALADCQSKGLVRLLATTNMDCPALEVLLDAGVPLVSNQVQFSLLDRRPLNGMLQLAQARGLKLLTYGSLGGGLLSDRYVEEPKKGVFGQPKFSNVDLNTSSLKMYWNVARLAGGQDYWRRLLLVLRRVADRHACSVAAVALAWVLQAGGGGVTVPIVGLRGTQHIADNAEALGLRLNSVDCEEIDAVVAEAKGPGGDIYGFERAGR